MNKFLEGEYIWDKKISAILTSKEIEGSGFHASQLDLEKRGYLKLEDLSCFINLYGSSMPSFKNKNVCTLFGRFTRS